TPGRRRRESEQTRMRFRLALPGLPRATFRLLLSCLLVVTRNAKTLTVVLAIYQRLGPTFTPGPCYVHNVVGDLTRPRPARDTHRITPEDATPDMRREATPIARPCRGTGSGGRGGLAGRGLGAGAGSRVTVGYLFRSR